MEEMGQCAERSTGNTEAGDEEGLDQQGRQPWRPLEGAVERTHRSRPTCVQLVLAGHTVSGHQD